jgi:hypothetical protein
MLFFTLLLWFLMLLSIVTDLSSLGPLVPKMAGSLLAEAVGFFRAKKSSACLPSEEK